MKKNFKQIIASVLMLVPFTFLTSQLLAQETNLKLVVTEVTTNFNYGKSNSALQSHKKNNMGLLAGLSFQAGVTEKFSVVAEGYYITKGGSLKASNPETNSKSSIRLHSVEMPVLARGHFGNFYVNAGPYVAYALGGKMKQGGSDNQPEEKSAVYFHDDKNGFNRWDMGVQAGGGYVFKLKKSSLALDVRYGYGLTSMSSEMKRYNRMLNISVIMYNPWKQNPFAKK